MEMTEKNQAGNHPLPGVKLLSLHSPSMFLAMS